MNTTHTVAAIVALMIVSKITLLLQHTLIAFATSVGHMHVLLLLLVVASRMHHIGLVAEVRLAHHLIRRLLRCHATSVTLVHRTSRR